MTAPDGSLLGIGELARASGVPASALRFYDREGVLVPAHVDPLTGYRRYARRQLRTAMLVATLRRVGMPLPDVRVVLERDEAGDPAAARAVVLAHEQRLVDGLADARREVARTLRLLDADGGEVVAARVGGHDLASALAAVRFAVAPSAPGATRPDGLDLAVLTGVLVEVATGAVRFVATDRYRMAVAGVRAREAPSGTAAGAGVAAAAAAVAPTSWADELAEACAAAPQCTVCIELGGGVLRATVAEDGVLGDRVVEAKALQGAYPDHRAVLDGVAPGPDRAASGLVDHLPLDVDRVGLAVEGERVVVVPDEMADVFVDPAFLHEALSVAGSAPVLALDGPLRPLAVRGPGPGFSVLMPVRAPGQGADA